MPLRLRPLAALLVLAPLAACASAAPRTDAALQAAVSATAASATAESRVVPPRMLTKEPVRIRRTERVIVSGPGGAPPPSMPGMRQPPDVSLRVDIDAEGRPDMGSLVISGSDAPDNRETLREWIQAARFAPATRDGVPVAGTFRWPR